MSDHIFYGYYYYGLFMWLFDIIDLSIAWRLYEKLYILSGIGRWGLQLYGPNLLNPVSIRR